MLNMMKYVAVNPSTPNPYALTIKMSVGSKWLLISPQLVSNVSQMKFTTLPKFGNLKGFAKP